jgi:hypothetical protein
VGERKGGMDKFNNPQPTTETVNNMAGKRAQNFKQQSFQMLMK